MSPLPLTDPLDDRAPMLALVLRGKVTVMRPPGNLLSPWASVEGRPFTAMSAARLDSLLSLGLIIAPARARALSIATPDGVALASWLLPDVLGDVVRGARPRPAPEPDPYRLTYEEPLEPWDSFGSDDRYGV